MRQALQLEDNKSLNTTVIDKKEIIFKGVPFAGYAIEGEDVSYINSALIKKIAVESKMDAAEQQNYLDAMSVQEATHSSFYRNYDPNPEGGGNPKERALRQDQVSELVGELASLNVAKQHNKVFFNLMFAVLTNAHPRYRVLQEIYTDSLLQYTEIKEPAELRSKLESSLAQSQPNESTVQKYLRALQSIKNGNLDSLKSIILNNLETYIPPLIQLYTVKSKISN